LSSVARSRNNAECSTSNYCRNDDRAYAVAVAVAGDFSDNDGDFSDNDGDFSDDDGNFSDDDGDFSDDDGDFSDDDGNFSDDDGNFSDDDGDFSDDDGNFSDDERDGPGNFGHAGAAASSDCTHASPRTSFCRWLSCRK